jgi:hypothetical protein
MIFLQTATTPGLIGWLNANAGAVTGIATFALAILTGFYVVLTRRMADAAASQARAALEQTRLVAAARRDAMEAETVERQRQHAAVATALIADLRAIEPVLTQLFRRENAGLWHGKRFGLFFNELRSETTALAPATVYAVSDVFRQVDDLFGMLEQEQASGNPNRDSPVFHHAVRTKAGFALQAIPAANAALIGEGGVIPAPAELPVTYYPELPKIPAPSFPDVEPPE